MLKNVKFEASVYEFNKLIKTDKPQIVLVGKSNVGKSSFINAISNQKKLAKVGQTPGKTRSINYYNVNNEFYIVDLPGYGYSTMSEAEKNKINKLIDVYISKTPEIKHIYFLVDIRNNPSANDRQMYELLLDKKIPFSIIATKADKVAKTKMEDYTKEITKQLFAKENITPFSADKKINIDVICDEILEITKQ